jgi:hypothetical protein
VVIEKKAGQTKSAAKNSYGTGPGGKAQNSHYASVAASRGCHVTGYRLPQKAFGFDVSPE